MSRLENPPFYAIGIYQPQLFRTLPNRLRLLELIKIFDSEHAIPGSVIRSRQPKGSIHAHTILIPNAGFGTNTSLHLESTPDICALLTTYFSSLSEPILPPFLFKAIWDWCGLDDGDDDTEYENNIEESGQGTSGNLNPSSSSSFSRQPGLPSPIPLSKTYTSPAESTRILIAQLLLHLMPSPNFSLLIYLLAFFSQVALVREENGVGVEDLSRMFGGRIFGGGSIPSSGSSASLCASASTSSSKLAASAQGTNTSGFVKSDDDVFNTTQTRREGETMMSWFLRRWAPISEGLFDVVDDVKMGLFRRTMARKDSLGKEVLSGWLSGSSGRQTGHVNDGRLVDGKNNGLAGSGDRRMDNTRMSDGGEEEFFDIAPDAEQPSTNLPPSIRIDMAPQGHSTPNSKAKKRPESWLHTRTSYVLSECDDDISERDREEMDERARLAEDSDQEEIDIVDDYSKSSFRSSLLTFFLYLSFSLFPFRLFSPLDNEMWILMLMKFVVLLTTTPTPAAVTGMKSTPLEIDDTLDIVRISSSPMIQVSSRGGQDVSPGSPLCRPIRFLNSIITFSLSLVEFAIGDERLMDISLPTFLNQTLPNHHEIDLKHPQPGAALKSRSLRDIGIQTRPATILVYQPDNDNADSLSDQQHKQQQQQLAQALESVSHLERQLRNCTDLVSDTLKELDVSRRESYVRARRIVELETALAQGGDISTFSSSSDQGKGCTGRTHASVEAEIAGRTLSEGDAGTEACPVGIERN